MRGKNLCLVALFFSLIPLSTAFIPQDNYLINCGSNRSISVDNRSFLGDSIKSGSVHLSQGEAISLKGQTSGSNLSLVYSTARVFTAASAYSFNIKKLGTHLVRLHFSPFVSQNFNLRDANFSVSANGVLLFKDFGVGSTVLREFIVMVDKVKLQILFTPTLDSGFGFVNAIEVFSAPDDFIIDPGIKLISPVSVKEFNQNLTLQTLETVHRVNVGGEKITPFNDTLWRTWVPDEDFLVLKSAAKLAWISHVPNYQTGGATKEIAPDNVYMTAQEMNWEKATSNFMFNITWSFPVGSRDSVHVVRLHFCDIVSSAPGVLYFNVYIDGVMAYKDLDLSALTFHVLASPYYIDFVVYTGDSGVLQISVGPSDMSSVWKKNAILNGVEIMKMLNVVGLRDGSRKKNVWILVVSVISGVALVSLALLAMLALLKCRKKKPKPKRTESAGWTPLRQYGGSSLGTLSEGNALVPLGPNGYLTMRIPFADIQVATSNFDKSLIIGSGGFGMVYKGVLKDNIKWQKRGQIDQIVDPNIRDQIKPSALKKYGETAEKCLADYGVDRPTMGDVLWNLEYVLQLQGNGGRGEPDDEVNPATSTEQPPPPPRAVSTAILADNGNAVSDISTSQVFSQLITNDGR
nr:probable receptor-like protein kinase At5g24010 [Ipomoea batatas]